MFDEDGSWNWGENENTSTGQNCENEEEENNEQQHASNNSDSEQQSDSNSSSNDSSSDPELHLPLNQVFHRNENSSRRFKTIQELYETTQVLLLEDPTIYEEAAEKEEWCNAMEEEIQVIEKNKTWELVKLPDGKNVIGVKWIFKTKLGADEAVQKFKKRLVAKGYTQEYGIDYEKTFSPVARFETVRLILAMAVHLRKHVYQFDVKSAFLNSELKEVYVQQPRGFEVKGKEDHVYKLSKALYGLKQAPRALYSKIDAYFIGSGFLRSKSEPNLYVKSNNSGEVVIVCLYVDDMIYLSTSEKMLAEFRTEMKKQFEMSDLGLMNYFFGLEVEQTNGSIFLSQKKYAKYLLKKFGMHSCKAASTPMNFNEKLTREDGSGFCDETKFRSLVGGLIYLTHTRPDILYSVGVISRFMHQPTKHHFGTAKRILRYIAGTCDHGIWYNNNTDFAELVGYYDSDWAGCTEDRKSTSGQIFLLGTCPISWSSKKQATITLSSAEVEYIALNSAACQVVWLRKILEDVGCL